MMKLLDMPKKLSINEPYSPAEDTFFFAEHLKDESGEKALDVGTGSGYLAKLLSPNLLKNSTHLFVRFVICNILVVDYQFGLGK